MANSAAVKAFRNFTVFVDTEGEHGFSYVGGHPSGHLFLSQVAKEWEMNKFNKSVFVAVVTSKFKICVLIKTYSSSNIKNPLQVTHS